MPDEHDILRLIAREPDEDAPRLVYADWLLDDGDTDRADFTRAQVRLATMKDDSPERRELAFRCRRYLDEYETEWSVSLRGECPERHWSRGFVEVIDLTPQLLDELNEVFDTLPVRRLILTDLGGKIDALHLIPHDHRLTALELINGNLDLRGLKKLAKVDHLRPVGELSLMFNRLGDSSVQFLCEEPFFQRLSLLRLGCNPFTERGRDRLREHFGDRVSFARERFPGRLYAIEDRQTLGWGRDHVQLLLAGRELAVFDHAGNLLSVESCPVPEVESDDFSVRYGPIWEWGRARMKEWECEGKTIRVQRFRLGDYWGIDDFNWWADTFDDPRHPQRDEVRGLIGPWLSDGQYQLGECWYDRGGEVTDS